MIIAVDIGNTNIVIGGFDKGELCFFTRMYTQRELEADQYALDLHGILQLHGVTGRDIAGVIISSVVPQITPAVQRAMQLLAPQAKVLMFGPQLCPQTPIRIDNPAELGADLLAGAVGAAALYPLPAIVIDMGTATKITAVDADGAVLGVSIMPGLFISLEALTRNASLLNGIAPEAPACAIGKNTAASMQSGAVLGSAGMLDGMIDRFTEEMGGVRTVVATGGAAGLVVPSCRHKIIYNEKLILQALYYAYKRNDKGD